MLIHYAFGSLAKQGKIEEQTKQVIELILKEKRLLVSKCKEFIPAYPRPGAKHILSKMFKVTGDGEASVSFDIKDPNWLNNLPNDTTIHYLPLDVPMICFTTAFLNQLNNSTHIVEYGKLGLVFTNIFLKIMGAKPVSYYTENSLWHDEFIKKWNSYEQTMGNEKSKQLAKEITSYRKPATLFSSFKESITIKLTRQSQETTIEYFTYDRYPENYDFTKENEHRIIFNDGTDYLNFKEDDLYMVITPDLNAKNKIETFFKNNWTRHPIVKLYPG